MTKGNFFDTDFFWKQGWGIPGEEARERLGCAAIVPHHEWLGSAAAMEWFSSGQKPKAKSATKSLSKARAHHGYPFNAQGIE